MDAIERKPPARSYEVSACNCIGPRNGEPFCHCMMRGIIIRNGRYIRPEQDLGPVSAAKDPLPYFGARHDVVLASAKPVEGAKS